MRLTHIYINIVKLTHIYINIICELGSLSFTYYVLTLGLSLQGSQLRV